MEIDKREYKAGKKEEEDDGRTGVCVVIDRASGRISQRKGHWLIWKNEKQQGTARFDAEGTTCTKVQRLEQADEQ